MRQVPHEHDRPTLARGIVIGALLAAPFWWLLARAYFG